jgi:hypothetical protein
MVIAMIANERGQGDREDGTTVTRPRPLMGTAVGLSGASITRGWVAPAGSTGPLLNEKRRGNFACTGCEVDLFSSTTKFASGTSWLSPWAPLEGAIGTITA